MLRAVCMITRTSWRTAAWLLQYIVLQRCCIVVDGGLKDNYWMQPVLLHVLWKCVSGMTARLLCEVGSALTFIARSRLNAYR